MYFIFRILEIQGFVKQKMNFISFLLIFPLYCFIIKSKKWERILHMSSDSVRIPQQKRSSQKKQAIIQAGYTLFF